MLAAAAAVLLVSTSAPPPPSAPTFESDRSVDVAPKRLVRVGAGFMIGGGALMAIGAGVLVPISLGVVARAQPPDPENYTAVPPFEADLYAYRLKIYHALRLGIAGAITAGAGAVVFVAGAATWGLGKRRMRRAPSFALLPTRGGGHGSVTLRF
jgi:hypothetical protein